MNAEYHDAPEQQRLTNRPCVCSLPVFASPLAACQTGRLAHGTATRRAAEDRPPTPKPIAVHILISDHEKTNIYQSGSKLQSSRESSTELTYAATRQQTAPENDKHHSKFNISRDSRNDGRTSSSCRRHRSVVGAPWVGVLRGVARGAQGQTRRRGAGGTVHGGGSGHGGGRGDQRAAGAQQCRWDWVIRSCMCERVPHRCLNDLSPITGRWCKYRYKIHCFQLKKKLVKQHRGCARQSRDTHHACIPGRRHETCKRASALDKMFFSLSIGPRCLRLADHRRR